MKAIKMTEPLYEYITSHCRLPHPILDELREETEKLPNSRMQIGTDQGAFLNFMVKLIGAHHVLEIGCFTGYSAICMASALPPDGKLVTLDVSPEYTAIASKFFQLANLHSKIEVRLGSALDSLRSLQEDKLAEGFDLAFIDADKVNMWNYYEACLKLVRKNGLILVDNVLWGGSVVDNNKNDADTAAIRDFNDRITQDPRVEQTLLYLADGVMMIRV